MKNLLVLLSVFACLVAANGSFRGSLKDFLNRGPTQVRVETPQKSIAVVVNGGDEEADSVADKCGVLNQGQVGNLVGVYHFQLNLPSEQDKVMGCLEGDERVTHFELQTYKTMVPKEPQHN